MRSLPAPRARRGSGLGILLISGGVAAAATALAVALSRSAPPAGSQPASAPPAPGASSAAGPVPAIGQDQAQLCAALWRAVQGNIGAAQDVQALALAADRLSPAMRAYFVAAAQLAPQMYQDEKEWIARFDLAEEIRVGEREAAEGGVLKEGSKAIAWTGTAMAAAATVATTALGIQAIPVFGQVVGACLALAAAIAVAIAKDHPVPKRAATDQIMPGYEGLDCVRGLRLAAPPLNRALYALRALIEADPVLSQLPGVPDRAQFPFIPTAEDVQKAALDMGLYGPQTPPQLSDVWPRPETETQRNAYGAGYWQGKVDAAKAQALLGSIDGSTAETRGWRDQGIMDALAVRASRVPLG